MFPVISSRMGTVARGAQFEVEIVHLPQGKKRVTRTACGGTAMPKGSPNPGRRVGARAFLATEEFQWLISRAGGHHLPRPQEGHRVPELFAGGPFPRSPRVTVDAMAYARTEPYVPRYDDLKAAIVKEIGSVWTGESSVRDAVTRARAVAEPILADGLSQIK